MLGQSHTAGGVGWVGIRKKRVSIGLGEQHGSWKERARASQHLNNESPFTRL